QNVARVDGELLGGRLRGDPLVERIPQRLRCEYLVDRLALQAGRFLRRRVPFFDERLRAGIVRQRLDLDAGPQAEKLVTPRRDRFVGQLDPQALRLGPRQKLVFHLRENLRAQLVRAAERVEQRQHAPGGQAEVTGG